MGEIITASLYGDGNGQVESGVSDDAGENTWIKIRLTMGPASGDGDSGGRAAWKGVFAVDLGHI